MELDYNDGRVETRKLSELNEAVYNPRVKLKPGMEEYEALKKSITTFGYIDLIVVNGSIRGTFVYTGEGMTEDMLKYFHEVEWLHPSPWGENLGSTSYVAIAKRPRYCDDEKFLRAMKWEFDTQYNEDINLGMGDIALETAQVMLEQLRKG